VKTNALGRRKLCRVRLHRCFRQDDGNRHGSNRSGTAATPYRLALELFDGPEPEWVPADDKRINAARRRDFGDHALGGSYAKASGGPDLPKPPSPAGVKTFLGR
jgi:hypothetical protein